MKTTSVRSELYERALRKYHQIGDELQVMEMADGLHDMLRSELYTDYIALGASLERMRAALPPGHRGERS